VCVPYGGAPQHFLDVPFHAPRSICASAQSFSKHVDPETGHWYYENVVTGERHWDRPLEGVAPVRPKSPSPEEKLVDDA